MTARCWFHYMSWLILIFPFVLTRRHGKRWHTILDFTRKTIRQCNENVNNVKHEVFGTSPALTQACDKLFKVNEGVFVVVKQAEQASSECRSVHATAPRCQAWEELNELSTIYPILLQIGQARVMTLCSGASRPPIAAHDVLGLEKRQRVKLDRRTCLNATVKHQVRHWCIVNWAPWCEKTAAAM